MKLCPLLVVLAVMLRSAVGLCEGEPQRPQIEANVPWVGKVGEPFTVKVSLRNAGDTPVLVEMETTNITYSQTKFPLMRGKQKLLQAKVVRTQTGLAMIRAFADGYDDAINYINVGYRGRLKLSSTEKLPYEERTTLSLQLVDSDGKLLPAEYPKNLKIESSDSELFVNNKEIRQLISIDGGATISPQFQIKPKSIWGGIVHLNAALELSGTVLTQETFTLVAQPAWWLPLILAIAGGMLHAVYKISRLPDPTFWSAGAVKIFITSAVAGFVGYLLAHFDLFGLKLDPNVLRTYLLIGFLVSYFGIEVLLSGKLTSQKSSPDATSPTSH